MIIKQVNFTVRQFMGYMNIGRTKAYEMIHDKSFYPAFRVGRKILINKEKLDKWIDENTIVIETEGE